MKQISMTLIFSMLSLTARGDCNKTDKILLSGSSFGENQISIKGEENSPGYIIYIDSVGFTFRDNCWRAVNPGDGVHKKCVSLEMGSPGKTNFEINMARKQDLDQKDPKKRKYTGQLQFDDSLGTVSFFSLKDSTDPKGKGPRDVDKDKPYLTFEAKSYKPNQGNLHIEAVSEGKKVGDYTSTWISGAKKTDQVECDKLDLTNRKVDSHVCGPCNFDAFTSQAAAQAPAEKKAAPSEKSKTQTSTDESDPDDGSSNK